MNDADVDRTAAAEVLERLCGDLTRRPGGRAAWFVRLGSWAEGDFHPACSLDPLVPRYGAMFWLTWNRLSGSYFRLVSTRRL